MTAPTITYLQQLMLATYAEQLRTLPTWDEANRRFEMLTDVLDRAIDDDAEFDAAMDQLLTALEERDDR